MALRDWPIQQKLTAMLVLISGLVLLLTSAAFAGYQYWSLRSATRDAVALRGAYLVSRILQGTISQPNLALAETARAVSTRQDDAVRAPQLGADELGALTDAFNQMLRRIAEQKGELQRYAADLEKRVEERTHELQERNESLRRNAAELLAANTELDAFAYSVSHDLRAPL